MLWAVSDRLQNLNSLNAQIVAVATPLFLGQLVGAIQGVETLDW